ncbi:MAG: response regulator [Bacteroidota bacterium]
MKKILLVEDNLEMRENTAEILELANYEILTAENGRVGVQMARTHVPDMILCDIMMPEMDGYGVLYMLTKDPLTASIPFIFLTAKADRSDIRKGMTLGADDYLTKPFEEMELLETIESRFKRSEIIRKEYERGLSGLNAFLDEARGQEALRQLSQERKVRTYQGRENIFYEGEYPNELYYLIAGKVKTWRMNEDGKELITGLYKPGEFIGYHALLAETIHGESASTLEDTELALIPKADFTQLVHRNRDVALRFIKMLANNVHEQEEKLLSLAYRSVRSRVAEALLLLQRRYREQSDETFTISITRDDLAGLVGTATESLIRTLSEFKKDKMIEVKGRKITILDERGLARIMDVY